MIQFKIDENLPAEVAIRLAGAGHDAVTVLDQELKGAPDAELSKVCQDEGRVILTLDLDFSDIRTYPPADYSGIIVLRLASQDKNSVLAVIDHLIPVLESEPIARRLLIVDEQKVRIRE